MPIAGVVVGPMVRGASVGSALLDLDRIVIVNVFVAVIVAHSSCRMGVSMGSRQ